jgi:hypothetical protein
MQICHEKREGGVLVGDLVVFWFFHRLIMRLKVGRGALRLVAVRWLERVVRFEGLVRMVRQAA